jgi:hypothetical protein
MGFHIFATPEKNGKIRLITDFRKLNLLLKDCISSIFNSKDWGYDPFNGRVFICFSIGLKYDHIKIDYDAQKLFTIVFPCHMENEKTNAYLRVSIFTQS